MRIIAQKPGSLEDYLKPDFPRSFMPAPAPKQEAPIMNYISDSGLTSNADVSVVISLTKLAGNYRDRASVRFARDIRLRDLDEGNYIFAGKSRFQSLGTVVSESAQLPGGRRVGGSRTKGIREQRPAPRGAEGLCWPSIYGHGWRRLRRYRPHAEPCTGTAILILQGLQQEGTEAAGRFLADSNQRRVLREALGISSDPKSKVWFEALIRTQAVAGAPNSEAIVAARLIH